MSITTHKWTLEKEVELRIYIPEGQKFALKVLVCGPVDVGKSTLCNILTNYSIRAGFPTIYVDLDMGQSEILPTGLLGGVLVDQPFFPNAEISSHCPLSYFYGHSSMDEQPELYKYYIKQLADSIFVKMERSPKIKSSGFIVNTCGYIVRAGLDAIKYAIECFKIDLVIVVDSALLYSQLKDMCQEPRYIMELPKSGGAVNVDRKQRKKNRIDGITQYFYGIEKDFHPHSATFSFSEVNFYKIGRPSVSVFCLPVGSDMEKLNLEVMKVGVDEDMIYHLCAISCGEKDDEILSSNIYGLIVITNIDIENCKITVMSPAPPPFPSKNFVIGSIKYLDIQ